jgi:hypothetical protein
MKRYISAILVPCLLLQLSGCYSMQEISTEELINRNGEDDIQVITKENKTYVFDEFNYKIFPDSISGKGNLIVDYSEFSSYYQEFEGTIAFSEIESLYTDEFNLTETIFILGMFAFVLLGIVAFVIKNDFEESGW